MTSWAYILASLIYNQHALFKEDYKVEKQIYYVSKTLHSTETRYPPKEKLAFALVTTAKKCERYFYAHKIKVYTYQPLPQAFKPH